MPRWTYRVTDFVSGRLVHEHVPFSGVRFTDELGLDGGTFQGSYPVAHAGMPDIPGDACWRLMVWPCRDGVPQGAYVITGASHGDLSSPVAQLQGDRFTSVLFRRELRHDLNFTAKDQLDIARDLIRYGIGINTAHTDTVVVDSARAFKALRWFRFGSATSTAARTIKVSTKAGEDDGYNGKSGKFIGPLLTELSEMSPPAAGVLSGFEFRTDYGWDAEDVGFWGQVTFGWPTIGRKETDPKKIIFEYPSKAVPTCSYSVDSGNFATRVRVVGKDRGATRPIGTATNNTLLGYGYPLLDKAITSGQITESNRLNDRAATVLYRQSRLSNGWSITLNPSAQPEWGDYRIGDYVTLRVRRGDGLKLPDQTLRITGWEVAPHDTGEAEVVTPHLMAPGDEAS